jgi:hypothetical protein
MRYNDAIAFEYGTSDVTGGYAPVPYKPLPSPKDYDNGYINRTFAKKINENIIMEMDYASTNDINQDLYAIVVMSWKISGPRENIYDGNTIVQNGVATQNKFEIERVKKENGIDLSKALPNLLEYWRGR